MSIQLWSLIIAIIALVFTSGLTIGLWWKSRQDEESKEKDNRRYRVLQVRILEEVTEYCGPQLDQNSDQIDSIVCRLSHCLIEESLGDLGLSIANWSDRCSIDGNTAYVYCDIIDSKEHATIVRLKLPIFDFNFESNIFEIFVPRKHDLKACVFHPADWKEFRNRIENFVSGTNDSSQILTMRYSDNVQFDSIPIADDYFRKILVKQSIVKKFN